MTFPRESSFLSRCPRRARTTAWNPFANDSGEVIVFVRQNWSTRRFIPSLTISKNPFILRYRIRTRVNPRRACVSFEINSSMYVPSEYIDSDSDQKFQFHCSLALETSYHPSVGAWTETSQTYSVCPLFKLLSNKLCSFILSTKYNSSPFNVFLTKKRKRKKYLCIDCVRIVLICRMFENC